MHAVHAAEETFETIRGDRIPLTQEASVAVDIADAASVRHAFERARPDAVLLLAAMSDIDRCESNAEQAFATNAYGVEHVANACARSNAKLLFTSTAAVFDGKKHGYVEEDAVSPLSVYGETKAWAENAVTLLVPSAIIIRFALVLGFAGRSGTNAMLDRLVAKWSVGEAIAFPRREERNPIDAVSLSRLMVDLLAREAVSGLYHVGAADSISRYELGKRLAARAGFSTDLALSQDEPIPGRALRGEDHFLLTDKLRKLLKVEAQPSNQVIERCFDEAASGN